MTIKVHCNCKIELKKRNEDWEHKFNSKGLTLSVADRKGKVSNTRLDAAAVQAQCEKGLCALCATLSIGAFPKTHTHCLHNQAQL